MKKYFLAMLLTAITIVTLSCGENGVEPEKNYESGRRDYTWTVTEIKPGNESLYLTRIWGSSPNDVWSIGTSSWTATSLWHYNGMQWRCDSIPRAVQPSAIYGFSKNEVWLGNVNSSIWKYNGNDWVKYGEHKVAGFDNNFIINIAGKNNNDIYSVGFGNSSGNWQGVLMHYDGTIWSFVNIPKVKVGLQTIAIDSQNGELVMSGTDFDPTGFIAKLYSWDGTKMKELLSEQGWSFVTKLGEEIYATMNSKIYKYSDKQLTLWKDNTGTGINGNIICGRSRNDFFIGSTEGIKHYNGTDFTTVFPSSYEIQRGIIFEKDVFFNSYEFSTGKNYIIHGQLK
jgi:hypothetical protein